MNDNTDNYCCECTHSERKGVYNGRYYCNRNKDQPDLDDYKNHTEWSIFWAKWANTHSVGKFENCRYYEE